MYFYLLKNGQQYIDKIILSIPEYYYKFDFHNYEHYDNYFDAFLYFVRT